jgi:ubiquinone/menaquinone biosynthesis C-methylase UbiE
MSEHGYIHSFSAKEQDRLLWQARMLEPWHHPWLDFSTCRTVLEIGCGVGAQITVLKRRHPHLKITGMDFSALQLARARQVLREPLARGQVGLVEGSAYALPFADASFDGACMFWVLEHLDQRAHAMAEARRVLKPGGRLYCTEVFNAGLHTEPPSPHIAAYWPVFNAQQRAFGGDPDVGNRLAELAQTAGFRRIEIHDGSVLLDSRLSEPNTRRENFTFMQAILLSAAPQLVAAGTIPADLPQGVRDDFEALIQNPAGIFFYPARQLLAIR